MSDVEDVLGGRTDPHRFAAFLADWEAVLARRVEAAVAAFAAVDGVVGLVLAGGVGRGEPWPLSDIDLLPIYDDARMAEAQSEVERRRVALLAPWVAEGWWTGLDVGRLAFGRAEVVAALASDGPGPASLLGDDRWYHAVDKAYRGRAAHDPEGLAGRLAGWFTEHRFNAETVRFRLARNRSEVAATERRLRACLERRDAAGATMAIRSAVKWLQTGMLEGWGERDNSLGRLGTRFARLARDRGREDLVDAMDDLSDLGDSSLRQRLATAPGWVWERHDRSWRARRHVGEAVTRLEDARDTLRVCTLYAARQVEVPPFPGWLAIPTDAGALNDKAAHLVNLRRLWFAELPE